ncbi:hypothetical protein QEN19_004245 [Hanseniaspora menglaensis]
MSNNDSNNNNNVNKFDRRSYDPSKKKSFSNYMSNRPNTGRQGYSNSYNNDRFTSQKSSDKGTRLDLPDRNATTFDLSAAIMMGMQNQDQKVNTMNEEALNTTDNTILPRKQNMDNGFYNTNKVQNHTNNNYQSNYHSNQPPSTSRFQSNYSSNDHSRWNKTPTGSSLNRSLATSGNPSSRFSGNVSSYNSSNNYPQRSRFQGGSTYVPNSGRNISTGGNPNYYRPTGSRFDNSQSSKYNSQSNYQRSDNNYNTYINSPGKGNPSTSYNGFQSDSQSVVSGKDKKNLNKTPVKTEPSHSFTKEAEVDERKQQNLTEKEAVNHKTERHNNKESDTSVLNVKNEEDVKSPVKLPFKKKQIIDDDEEAIDVNNESEVETDAMDTPLKPRKHALEDSIKSKVKTELQPTVMNDTNKQKLTESKKSLINEIEAEAKYFSSLSGSAIGSHQNPQRQVSIKRDPYGKTKLHSFVNKQDLLTVKNLIEQQGYDPNLQDYAGMTALHYACAKGFYNIAEYLVSVPNINMDLTTEDNSETALFDACIKLEVDIVRLLLEHNAKISIENSEKKNVLVYMKEALEDEDYENEEDKDDLIIIINLLEKYWRMEELRKSNHVDEHKKHVQTLKNVDVNSEHISSDDLSEESDNSDEELEFDIMDIASKYGTDKLYKASCKGDYNYVGQFLQNGGRPDKESFIECCKRGHMDLINLFLALTNMNVNMKIPQSNGKSLLMVCCGRGNFDVIKLLVDSGADVLHLDDNDRDVLYYAKKNQKSGWEKEYEFLKEKIEIKGTISKKRKEISIPISPKRVVKPKSKTNTPKSPLIKNNSRSNDNIGVSGTVTNLTIDSTANAIKRKFYQLTEEDVMETQSVMPKTKKQPIIKKVKLGGTDESPSSSVPPLVVTKGNLEAAQVLNTNSNSIPPQLLSSIAPVTPLDKTMHETGISVIKHGDKIPIENMKEQKTREIFEQMEKYEKIKKEKEQEEIKKQLEKERIAEEKKQQDLKLKEQEFALLSGNLLCMGLRSVTNDNVPIKISQLANVGPIYYRVINDEIYVLNVQLYYIFNGNDIISDIKKTVVVKNSEYEINKIWCFYKDLFLLGYKNDKNLVEFFNEEVLAVDSLDFKLQFELYQKSLLQNIELSWIAINEVFAKITKKQHYGFIVQYLVNNLIEIAYDEEKQSTFNSKAESSDLKETQCEMVAVPNIYYSDMPQKLKNRPSMREIINDQPLW